MNLLKIRTKRSEIDLHKGHAFYLSIPSPVINDADKVQIGAVSVINSEYKSEDITSRIDCEKLARVIGTYNRSKLPHHFAPRQIAVGDIEIDYIYNNKSKHIILGSVNVVYVSADKGGYEIQDGDKLLNDIKKMIQ